MKRLSIGQMAKMNRVSEKAPRLYHENGILVPAYVDESSGRRYYDIQQSTKYLSLYLYQAYDHGRELDSERLLRMRDYAYNKKMVIAGDAFGESLCRYPRFFDSGDFLLYRLCVPVRPA